MPPVMAYIHAIRYAFYSSSRVPAALWMQQRESRAPSRRGAGTDDGTDAGINANARSANDAGTATGAGTGTDARSIADADAATGTDADTGARSATDAVARIAAFRGAVHERYPSRPGDRRLQRTGGASGTGA